MGMATGRTFVIGDIHGCGKALRTLIEDIMPLANDTMVFLGDYIDRGPNSRDVIDQLIELKRQCRAVFLRGNHEVMLQAVLNGGANPALWIRNGGRATMASYGGTIERIPEPHREFLDGLRPHYETSQCIFVHANYDPTRPMHLQDEQDLYWRHLCVDIPIPHHSGKTVFVGHTPQAGGRVLDLGHLVCMDTYCFGGGYL